MDLVILGRMIQALREEKKISQEQLANALGCSQSTISNYEKGKRRIYISHIEKLAEVLDTPISTFLEAEEKTGSTYSQLPPSSNQILNIIHSLYFLDAKDLNELDCFIKYLLWKEGKGGTDDEL